MQATPPHGALESPTAILPCEERELVQGLADNRASFLEEVAGLGFWSDREVERREGCAQKVRVTTEPSHRDNHTHASQLGHGSVKQWGQSQLQWGDITRDPDGLKPPKLSPPRNLCFLFSKDPIV